MSDEERRHSLDRRVAPSVISAQLLRRISWPALGAGTVLALAVQLMFMILATALEISLVAEHPDAAAGLWRIITAVASLMAGGWAAARTAGVPSRSDSAMHGLFTWALTVVSQGVLARFLSSVPLYSPVQPHEAFWTFLALLSGIMAATLSGWHAAPHDVFRFPQREPGLHERA